MTSLDGWENAFVAMSVALGATADEARDTLDPAVRGRVEPLVRALSHPARDARARALASGLGRIALAVEKARLA